VSEALVALEPLAVVSVLFVHAVPAIVKTTAHIAILSTFIKRYSSSGAFAPASGRSSFLAGRWIEEHRLRAWRLDRLDQVGPIIANVADRSADVAHVDRVV
jgi:hypothetical protein